MARKQPQRPKAEERKVSAEEVTATTDGDAAELGTTKTDTAKTTSSQSRTTKPDSTERSTDKPPADPALWTDVRIDPVEIALPAHQVTAGQRAGTGELGYTLRAYRLSTELAATDISDRVDDDDMFAGRAAIDDEDEEVVILDEEFAALTAEESSTDESAGDEADEDKATADDEPGDKAKTGETVDRDTEEDEEPGEEVPFFLTHRGRLLLFKSPDSLVEFIRSGAPHDLADLDTWPELVKRVKPEDIVATDDDTYELDLVVENLRGGNDTWDTPLLIRAGEIARDLGYALRLRPVLTTLAAGSPLDALDEALRASTNGGISGFMGRRRLRKMGAQQLSLSWRTIIGKISDAVDWRD